MVFFFRRKDQTRKSRPASQLRRFVRRLPLSLEVLESRILLDADSWLPASGSGNWSDASHWSLGYAPGPDDTAIINTNTDATITIQSTDNIRVQSVSTGSNDTLSIAGGTLAVTSGNSTLSGALSMTSGSLTASGSGVSLTANGSATISAASLYAQSGATLSLPQLTSYTANNSTFDADGAGSVLDVSALTTTTLQNKYSEDWSIYAVNGGTLKMTGLTSLGDSSQGRIALTDTGGGSLLLNSSLTTLDGVDVTLDGTDTKVANAWTKLTNGSLSITGGSYNLTAMTDVNDSSLYVSNGASLLLSGLTSYAANETTFSADGKESVLDVSALTATTLSSSYYYDDWNIDATNGATLKMSGLTSLGDSSKGTVYLADTGGSTLLDSNLTTLDGVDVTLDGTDTNVAKSWTKLTNGSLSITGGSYNLTALTDVDGSSLAASDGGSLALPGVTSYAASSTTFSADGTSSVLDVSALTTTTQKGNWAILATNGATIKMAGVTNLSSSQYVNTLTETGGSTLLLNSSITTLDHVNVTLDGTGAQIANPWTKLTNGSLIIEGGSYDLTGLTDVDDSSLEVSGGGSLVLPGLISYTSNNTIFSASDASSVLDVSALTTMTRQGNTSYDSSGWSVNAYGGGTIKLNALTSIGDSSSGFISLSDIGGSKLLLNSSLTTLDGVDVTLDGTDTNVAKSWTKLTNGSLSITGGSYNLTGLTDVDGSSLYASNGGSLILSAVTSYDATNQSTYSTTFSAYGAGSVLDLSTLTTTTLPSNYSVEWTIEAVDGGTLKLTGLTSLGDSSKGTTYLSDTGGSTLLDSNLTTLDGVDVTLDGTDTNVAKSWTKLTNGSLSITGGSYNLTALTDVDGSSLAASDGGSLALPGVNSYSTAAYYTSFSADGAGSVLDLSALTALTQKGNWSIYATNGGTLKMAGLTSLNGSGGTTISLTDTGGSTLLLNSGITKLDHVDVSLDGADAQIASAWTKLTNGSLNVEGGVVSLAALTDIDGSSLDVTNGGSLALPGLTSYSLSGTTFSADGAGSVLDVSALTTTTLQNNNYYYDDWDISVTDGATLKLTGLTSLGSSSEGNTFLTDTGGSSLLLSSSLTTLDGVDVTLDGTDTKVANAWTKLTNGSLSITGGSYNLTALTDVNGSSLSVSGGSLALPGLIHYSSNNAANFSVDGDGSVLDLSALQTFASNGGSLTVQSGGTLKLEANTLTMPTSGSGLTINVPQLPPGILVNLATTGTLDNTTFNIAAGDAISLSGGTYTGGVTFNLGQGASVDLTGGSYVSYAGTLTASGAGTVQLNSGTVTIGSGGLTLNFSGDTFQWTGGDFDSSQGNLTNQGTINLAGYDDKYFSDAGTLDNFGSIIQSGTGNLNLNANSGSTTTLKNEAGAAYLIESDSGIDNLSGGSAVVNAGTIRKTGGSGTSTLTIIGALTNTGTVEADSGTLDLEPVSFSQLPGSTLTGGTWNAFNGATLMFPTGTKITSNAATIGLTGSGAAILGLGSLASNSGSISIGAGANFTTSTSFSDSGQVVIGSGSTLTLGGSFTVAAGGSLNNSGQLVIPAADTLSVNGSYTQSATGVLTLDIGGDPASGNFGQLTSSTPITLGGTLNIVLTNGFGPTQGQVFPILTYPSATGSFATVNGLNVGRFPLFQETVNPTNITLTAANSVADLAVQASSITVPAQGVDGQNAPISYTVQNLSTTAATGDWYDSVYLALGPTLTPNDQLIARVQHTGGLAGQSQYTNTITDPLPGVIDGDYHVIVIADSAGLVPDGDRTNNTAVASNEIRMSMNSLSVGDSVSGTIASGQDFYYQLTAPPGHDVQVSANFGANAAAELFVRYQNVPTSASYDEYSFTPGSSQQVMLSSTQQGTYYILLHGQSGAGAGTSFTLATTDLNFGIQSISPNSGGNTGETTITVTGTQLTPTTQVNLVSSSGALTAAKTVLFKDSDTLFATFDLTGMAVGQYGVQISDHGETSTDAAAFTVVAGTGANVVYNMSAPEFVRNGTKGTVTITYENIGTSDAPAPLLTVIATNAVLKLPDEANFFGPTVQFLAIGQNGPAGVLAPGELGHITLEFQASSTAPVGSQISFELGLTSEDQAIDWSSVKDEFRPGYISAAAWDAIWSNFTASVGSTGGDLQAALDADASYLSQLGESVDDVNQLIGYEIQKASAMFTADTLASVEADSLPAPGMDLTFQQSFQASIVGRNTLGILGYGWTTNWDTTASTDAQGNVTIQEDGDYRLFLKQADGSYTAANLGDDATLTLSNGVYLLTEDDGSITAFNANGSLDYVQDTNGNRITAGYNSAGQLVTLTHSNGEFLKLAYNTQGRLATLTDSNGLTETYIYDPTGQFLTSYTDRYGTTNYTYVSGQSAAANNSLAEIAYADNTHIYFSYDSAGRFIDQHRDSGAEDQSITYGAGGGYTDKDASGDPTQILWDINGQTAESINPLGAVTRYFYDANGNLIEINGPQGTRTTNSYDANGNLLSTTDPLGRTTTYTYDARKNLLSYTDAKGNTTHYAYDSGSNLLAVTYADGTQKQYSYNPLGEATQFVNANGSPINYTYNADGLVASEQFANGSSFKFTYDTRGNLLTATSASGTIVFSYNDPRNPDFLTEVQYADGTYLKFTYNVVGQRTQSVDQTGFTVNYTYDSVGRLTKLTDGNGNLIVQYTYNDNGRLTQKDNGNGTRTVYRYDKDSNVLSITNYAPDHTTVNSFDNYTYDSLGNMLTDTSQDGAWTYTYDADSELIHAVFASANTAVLPNQDLKYAYDAAGNRISETANGVVTSYVTNNVNEYTSSTTNGVATTYQYDKDGNLISQTTGSSTTNYTFNALDQLTAINGPGLSASYSYDPLGNRVSQTVNGATTKFQIDPYALGNLAAEFDGSGNLIAHFTYGLGLVSQVSAAGSTGYYDSSLTGNTLGITGSAGTYINRYAYLPFGQTTVITAALANPFTYVGTAGVLSDGTGLIEMRARVYDPTTGQFLSNDPLGLAGGQVNLRRYVGNNPVIGTDVSGLCIHKPIKGKNVVLKQQRTPPYDPQEDTGEYIDDGKKTWQVYQSTTYDGRNSTSDTTYWIEGAPYTQDPNTGRQDQPTWYQIDPNAVDPPLGDPANGPGGAGGNGASCTPPPNPDTPPPVPYFFIDL